MTSALPNGWAETTAGEICDVVGGGTPDTKNPEYWGGEVVWITPADLSTHEEVYIDRGARSLTEAGLAACSARLMPAGSVLFSSRAPIGHVAIAATEVCTNQGFKSLVPPPGIDPRFLYWQLRWATPAIKQMGSGTTFREVSGKTMKALRLLVPPSAEQARIVAELERRLSHVDAAERGIRAALARLSLAREAVLWSAVLPASEAPQGDTRPSLPAGWEWAHLGEVAEVVGGVTKDSKRQHDPSFVEVPYLRVANVQRGFLDLSEVSTIRVSPEKAKVLRLERGDILFNEGGDRDKLGRGRIWEDQIPDCIHQNHVFRARLTDEGLDPRFVSWAGNSYGRRWFESAGKQTTNLASLNLRTLKSFPIPVPPAEILPAIIAGTERRLSLIDSVERTAEAGLAKISQLRRSLLNAAFSGQLVEQDPDDERATVLLERIRAERAAAASRKKRKTNTKRDKEAVA